MVIIVRVVTKTAKNSKEGLAGLATSLALPLAGVPVRAEDLQVRLREFRV